MYHYLYLYRFGGDAVNLLTTAFVIAASIAAALGIAVLLLKPKNYYGDARWAYRGEIRRARLMNRSGNLVGQLASTLLRNGEPAHVLVAAPTRSGKSVGIVIPNLLSWPGTVYSRMLRDGRYYCDACTIDPDNPPPGNLFG